MEISQSTSPGLKARFLAWYDRKIVKQVYKSWSFLANAFAVVVGVLPDLINLALENWGMVDALPVLEAKHKLVLFGLLHGIALVLRALKQKDGPPAATIPVATVNVPNTLDVSTGTGRTIPVQTEIHVVEGGGDGMSNAIFPDISEADRAIGGVRLRKLVLGVPAGDADELLGSNVIIARPPGDEIVDFEQFVPSPGSRMVTFEQLVEFGRQHAASLVDGVPWAFNFEGHAVTHENDDLYLISDLHTTHRLARGSVLWISAAGFLTVAPAPL